MSTDVPDTTNAAAPAATIDDDLRCCHCGYNLRTQPRGGRCPECAEPVANTLHLTDLTRAAPAYLDSVRRGATTYILAGIAASVARVLLVSLTFFFHGNKDFILWQYSFFGSAAEFALRALGPLLFLVATYRLTTPTGVAHDRLGVVCRIFRWAMAGWVALWFLAYLNVPMWWSELYADPRDGYAVGRVIATCLAAADTLLDVASAGLLWFWVARFAVRVGNRRLPVHARILTYLVPGAMLLPIVYSWAFYFWRGYYAPSADPRDWLPVGYFAALLTFVSVVWQFLLLLDLRRTLARLCPGTWFADIAALTRGIPKRVRKALSMIVRAVSYHGPNTPPPPASHNEP